MLDRDDIYYFFKDYGSFITFIMIIIVLIMFFMLNGSIDVVDKNIRISHNYAVGNINDLYDKFIKINQSIIDMGNITVPINLSITELQNKIIGIKNDISTLSSNHNNLDALVDSLKMDISNLNTKVNSLQSVITNMSMSKDNILDLVVFNATKTIFSNQTSNTRYFEFDFQVLSDKVDVVDVQFSIFHSKTNISLVSWNGYAKPILYSYKDGFYNESIYLHWFGINSIVNANVNISWDVSDYPVSVLGNDTLYSFMINGFLVTVENVKVVEL